MRNLNAAVKKSVHEAQVETENKTLEIQHKIDKFEIANEVLKPHDIKQEKLFKQKVIEKVIKDSFSFPEDDYALIELIKNRFLKNGKFVNKSETLRIGLNVLVKMSDKDLIEAGEGIQKVKIGRR